MSRARWLAGPAAMIASGGGLLAIALAERHWGIPWELVAFSGTVALAGVGLAKRSLSIQMLSRAVAWVLFVPTALVAAVSMSGHFEVWAAVFAAATGGALLLARPMLHTEEAKAQFAPSSFRRWLLAGATASAATGIMTGGIALDGFHWHSAAPAMGLMALSLSLLASAIGVVRMRAWGILLGAATSIATLLAAAIMHDAAGLALTLAAIPGLMLVLPVLIAQRDRAKADSATPYLRVAPHVGYDDVPPARVRVADDSELSLDEEADDARHASAPPPAPAARAQAS